MVTKIANIFLKNSLSTPITKEAPNPAQRVFQNLIVGTSQQKEIFFFF